tara:strand:+ start:287 stop:802 length:516 start_codon:yes stop_codon:yes gene_type:complete
VSWTEEKVNKLKELWGKGQSASQIAEIIGGLSRNAVIGKAHRLNLSAKIKTRPSVSQNFGTLKQNNSQITKRGRKGKFVLNKEMLEQLGPARLLTLEQLTESTCKYMLHEDQSKEGHPDVPGSFFCGRDTVDKYSYCVWHMGLVWQPKGKKEDLVDKDEVPQFIEKKIKSA